MENSSRKNKSIRQRSILTLSVDRNQSQTGGTRLVTEACEAILSQFQIIDVRYPTSFFKPNYLFVNLRLSYLLLRFRPLGFFADSRMFALIALPVLIARFLGIPFITTLQGSHHLLGGITWSGWRGALRCFLLEQVCKLSTLVIVNSSVTKQVAIEKYGVSSDCVRTVFPGFEPINRSYKKDIEGESIGGKQLRLLSLSKYNRRKGVDLLLKAVIISGSNKFDLIVAGNRTEGKEGDNYWASLLELNRKAHARLRSYALQTEVSSLYQWADLVIISSRDEAFGIVVLEALYHGKYVLVSDSLPGEMQAIDEHVYSFESDNPESLAEALQQMIPICLKARGIPTKSFITIEDWSWERFRRQFVEVFQSVIS